MGVPAQAAGGTVLYKAVSENLATLHVEAGELGRGLPRYVEQDFAKYLECGVLARGFARVRCESCKDELLVAFSCKGRGVCPSCNSKRAQALGGAGAAAHALPAVDAILSASGAVGADTVRPASRVGGSTGVARRDGCGLGAMAVEK